MANLAEVPLATLCSAHPPPGGALRIAHAGAEAVGRIVTRCRDEGTVEMKHPCAGLRHHPTFLRPASLLTIVLGWMAAILPTGAAQFQVDDPIDAVDESPGDGLCRTASGTCSLRAAIMEANALPGHDSVLLSVGKVVLSIAGSLEDDARTGDLDVSESLTVAGVSSVETTVDGAQMDRVFDTVGEHAISFVLSNLTVTGGVGLSGSQHERSGGGLRTSGPSQTMLEDVVFRSNSALNGGAVFNQGSLIGARVQFLDNQASGDGGGIYSSGDAVLLTDCLFSGNVADTAAVIDMAAFGNESPAQALLDRCSVVGNRSTSTGIVLNNSNTDFIVRNSTFSGNQSDGVLFNDGGSFFQIRNSTVFDNAATGVVDAHNSDQFVFMRNTVLAGNNGVLGQGNCFGRFTSEGGNYFGDVDGSCNPTFHVSDVIGQDSASGLSALQDRGAPWWQVHVPETGSPLLDAGRDDLCEVVDQVGRLRPQDGDFDGDAHCTIGALEIGSVDLVFEDGFESVARDRMGAR